MNFNPKKVNFMKKKVNFIKKKINFIKKKINFIINYRSDFAFDFGCKFVRFFDADQQKFRQFRGSFLKIQNPNFH